MTNNCELALARTPLTIYITRLAKLTYPKPYNHVAAVEAGQTYMLKVGHLSQVSVLSRDSFIV